MGQCDGLPREIPVPQTAAPCHHSREARGFRAHRKPVAPRCQAQERWPSREQSISRATARASLAVILCLIAPHHEKKTKTRTPKTETQKQKTTKTNHDL